MNNDGARPIGPSAYSMVGVDRLCSKWGNGGKGLLVPVGPVRLRTH